MTNALVTLPIRTCSRVFIGCRVSRFETPRAIVHGARPVRWTPTIAPGSFTRRSSRSTASETRSRVAALSEVGAAEAAGAAIIAVPASSAQIAASRAAGRP